MQQPALARGFRAVTPEQGLGSLEVALGLAPPALLIGLAGERANVRRCLEPAGLQAQRAELFVTLRPNTQVPRSEMVDRFGTPVRGELRVLDEMPLLDGRVDRQQLALLGERFDDGPAAPRNDLERRLLAIWQEILDAPRLGVRDNFFRFGGHSLLAVRLLSKIQQELGFEAPLAALFTAPTVERMAELFGAAASGGPAPAWSAVVPIQPAGTRPPFFCVAPILGTVFPYYELARHLGPDQPFFGLQPPALSTDGPSLGRIEDLARFFVDALRTVQPHGPYHLGGWSFGTMVAHEMAHKLRQGGEEVALVALLDAPAPVRSQRLSATGTLRAFYDVVVRNLWPYVRDYLYLVTVAEGTNGHEGGNGNGNGHGGSRLRRLVGRLRSLDSLQGLVERAAIASVVPKESRLVMLHPPEIRGMLRALRENGRAMKSYKGSPYPGRVTVFRTENGWGSKDTALGWGELADAVDVRHIPGNHMTLLRSPHVEALAAALREALEEARP
jgi:thioesterase domain-containing protein/acyl carrier protein